MNKKCNKCGRYILDGEDYSKYWEGICTRYECLDCK